MHHRSPVRRDSPPSILALFALVEDASDRPVIGEGGPLRQLAASWSVALVAQLIALISIIAGVSIAGPRPLAGPVLVEAVVSTLIGLGILMLLRVKPSAGWRRHIRIRLLTIASAALVVALMWLAHLAGGIADDNWRFASFVAAFGSIAVTAIALYAVRAAILSFALGMVSVTVILSGFGVASAIAVMFMLALILVAYRLALIDHHA